MTYRLGIVLLSAVVAFSLAIAPTAMGQRNKKNDENSATTDKQESDKPDSNKQDSDKPNKDRGERRDRGNRDEETSNQSDKKQQTDEKKQSNQQSDQGGQSDNRSNQNNRRSSNQSDKDQNNAGQNNDNKNKNEAGIDQSKSGRSTQSRDPNVQSQIQQYLDSRRKQGEAKRDDERRGDDDRRGTREDYFRGQNKSDGRFDATDPGEPGFQSQRRDQPLIVGPGGAGNAQPSNQKFGTWRGDRWEGNRKAETWSRAFGISQKPFSSGWYKDHPSAWRYENNVGNVWITATMPGVYSWLGWGDVPPQYGASYRTERIDHSRYGDWYPLGVFSLMSGEDDPGTRIVQLAVDRHGHINGNYFDMITSANNLILGNVDRNTQRAEFWLNRNPAVRFRASIYRLLQPYGSVSVSMPGGEQRWQFVRLEN